jgi:hypothetical protein
MENPFKVIDARLRQIESLLLDIKYPQPPPVKPVEPKPTTGNTNS